MFHERWATSPLNSKIDNRETVCTSTEIRVQKNITNQITARLNV